MRNETLTPEQLMIGLKPNLTYNIDSRHGRAIVLLPDDKNQARPTKRLADGDWIVINDLYETFEKTVEVRAPKDGTIDGKESLIISERNAVVKFTLIDVKTWVSQTWFNKFYDSCDVLADEPITKLVCDFNHLSLYNFELVFDTKYSIESLVLTATKDNVHELSHIGNSLVTATEEYIDGKLFLTVESTDNGKLSIRPISFLRK
ncbi:hypothetical protein GD1_237 [Paraglaciecola Antarctic GD virus 1]|nr:hypothetical protein GD1_237 [Paraglaciecola Antarctic GD virus 1]